MTWRFACGLIAVAFGMPGLDWVQPTGRSEVALTVTVTDAAGKYLPDLGPADFRVLEDGVEQTVSSASRITDVPIAFTLLLDASNSMESEFAAMQTMAVGFARRLRARDAAQVFSFGKGVRLLQGFTNDAARLEITIQSVSADGATALNNALYVVLEELKKRPRVEGLAAARDVVVVFSDGKDTSSIVNFNAVLDLAKRSSATIYAVLVDSGAPGSEEWSLPDLTRATGGRLFPVSGSPSLDQLTQLVLTDVAQQYLIRYTPSDARLDGRWRNVEVRVRVPKADVRARSGYFAAKSS